MADALRANILAMRTQLKKMERLETRRNSLLAESRALEDKEKQMLAGIERGESDAKKELTRIQAERLSVHLDVDNRYDEREQALDEHRKTSRAIIEKQRDEDRHLIEKNKVEQQELESKVKKHDHLLIVNEELLDNQPSASTVTYATVLPDVPPLKSAPLNASSPAVDQFSTNTGGYNDNRSQVEKRSIRKSSAYAMYDRPRVYSDAQPICETSAEHYPLAVRVRGHCFHMFCHLCGADQFSGPRGLHIHYTTNITCFPRRTVVTFDDLLDYCGKRITSKGDEDLIRRGSEPTEESRPRKKPKV